MNKYMNSRTDKLAKIIWDYMLMHQNLVKADIIIGFGSHDKRTAQWAAKLYLEGFAPLVLFSGNEGVGREVSGFVGTPEAEIYKIEAIGLGVPASAILTEDKSTNSGENILFTSQVLKRQNIAPNKVIVVHKPYMERRTYATLKAQWPQPQPAFIMSSIPITYEEYTADPLYSKDYITNTMVGDLQRIKEYPKYGYQVEQEIPDNVWAAYNELVKLGFNKHLLEV